MQKINKLLILILIISLFLRLHNINYMEFKGDEALNSFKALSFVENHEIPLTALRGTTGLNYPPVFIYLIAIPYSLSKDPVVATVFIALSNVLATFVCFLFVKKLFNEKAAVIAALLFAINPWQVVFSRKLWDVNLAAIFIFLFLLFVHNSIFTKKKHHIAYALACLGILLQLHLSLSYIALPALFLMIPNIRKIDKRYLAFGCLLFIVTTVPYAVFELKNNFSDVNILLEKSDEHYFHPNAFVIPFKMVSTAGFEGDFGTTFPIFISSLKYLYALDILAMIVLLLSLVYIATTKFRIFSLWFLLGIIYLSISKVPTIDTNYFTSLLPISFIIIGLAAASLIKRPNIKYVGYFILFIIVLHQFVFSLHFTNFVSEQECINGNYGMPYQYRLESIKENLQAFDDPIAYLKYINQISCDCRKCDIETAEYIIKKVI